MTPGSSVASAVLSDDLAVVARCDDDRLTAFLHSQTPFAGDVVYVLTRIGNATPRGDWSRTSQDNLNIFARSPADFVRDLHLGGMMSVTVKSRDAADREMAFDLPVDTAALESVMTDCAISRQMTDPANRPPGPVWAKPPRPSGNDFPEAPMLRGISGNATIACTASSEGRPENCFVVDEAPREQGFGSSALAIVSRGEVDMGAFPLEGGNGPAFLVNIPMMIDDKPAPKLRFIERIQRETEGLFPPSTTARP